LCCGDGFGDGSSGTQANDALNVARCMKKTDDVQWLCFVPIDHQAPEKWRMIGHFGSSVRSLSPGSVPRRRRG